MNRDASFANHPAPMNNIISPGLSSDTQEHTLPMKSAVPLSRV